MEFVLGTGIVIVVVAVGAVIIAAALRGMRPQVPDAGVSRPSPARRGSAPATSTIAPTAGLSPEVTAEIDRLVTAEQKIRAIKVYREHTGVGLQEAKDRIDHWSVSTTAPHTAAVSHASAAHSSITATAATVRAGLPASVAAEIDAFVASDQQIRAIKLVREQTGLGLKDSKQIVESWPHPHRR